MKSFFAKKRLNSSINSHSKMIITSITHTLSGPSAEGYKMTMELTKDTLGAELESQEI